MKHRWVLWMTLALLALFVIGGLMLWINQNLVKQSREIYTGYSDETVRNNSLYTAERLLNRLGASVYHARRLSDLPKTLDIVDTLLVVIPSYVLSATESQRLLDWVKQGGHLIIHVRHEFEPGQGFDHVLRALQIRSHRAKKRMKDPIPVKLDEAMLPLQVQFLSRLRFNDAPWQQIHWGRGRVTLLADVALFTNARLSQHDHADFLWTLTQQQDRGGQIWLQYRMLTPSLVQLLWQHAWMFLLGLILTLLAALWFYSHRLGPVLIPRSSEQRRLAEHLHASSRFLWRHGAGSMLLQAARQYTLRRLERRQAGISPDATALDASDQPLNEQDLIRTVQALQRLHLPRSNRNH